MSDDTLSQLVADAIADAIKKRTAAVVYAIWGVLLSITAGTAYIVTLVSDVRGDIREAHREAADARASLVDLRATVIGHEKSITILQSWKEWKGGGE